MSNRRSPETALSTLQQVSTKVIRDENARIASITAQEQREANRKKKIVDFLNKFDEQVRSDEHVRKQVHELIELKGEALNFVKEDGFFKEVIGIVFLRDFTDRPALVLTEEGLGACVSVFNTRGEIVPYKRGIVFGSRTVQEWDRCTTPTGGVFEDNDSNRPFTARSLERKFVKVLNQAASRQGQLS